MRNKVSQAPVFIALDVDDSKKALSLAQKLSPYVMGFKVGPRLCFRSESSFIKELSRYGKIFIDFKFHDIPSTMEASVRAAFESGADFVTVHASAGESTLQLLSQVEKDYGGTILAVTILTSQKAPLEDVIQMADKVYSSGLRGVVASPYEVKSLKEKYSDLFVVTPGIRMDQKDNLQKDDQVRVATPEFALKQGASALVIGRSILQADDPVSLIKTIMV